MRGASTTRWKKQIILKITLKIFGVNIFCGKKCSVELFICALTIKRVTVSTQARPAKDVKSIPTPFKADLLRCRGHHFRLAFRPKNVALEILPLYMGFFFVN